METTFVFNPMDLAVLLPEIVLATMACLILVMDAYLPDKRRNLTYQLTQGTLAGTALLIFATFPEQQLLAVSGLFVYDPMAAVLKLFITLIVLVTFVYSKRYLRDRYLLKGEYFVLGLFATLGMMVMVSAHNLLAIYLGLELLSLSLYAMVAMHRDSHRAVEAAMKYFVLGALASGMLLYGLSMLYGVTGTLDLVALKQFISQDRIVLAAIQEAIINHPQGGEPALTAIAQILKQTTDQTPNLMAILQVISQVDVEEAAKLNAIAQIAHQNPMLLTFGLVFIIIGLAFKLGAVPFHMWVPDVYQGAPTSVTLFISSAPKLAAFAMLMRLLVDGMQDLHAEWQNILILLSILSMALGNIVAIAQTNIKRMFAYSTIAHVGFLTLGVLTGTQAGYSAAMFYTLVYALMSLGGFGMILLLSRAGFEAEHIHDFKGLNERNGWYAFIMLILVLSMAGVPPMLGFWAKLSVLSQVVQADLVWLAVLAVLLAIVGAFYYLRIVWMMYFEKPIEDAPIQADRDMRVILSANGLVILLLGLAPHTLMSVCLKAMGVGG
jgi:NADH-quinone oxidoreductase subunit N